MIVVTGAYGFIGSYLTGRLNAMGLGQELVLVDDFNRPEKQSNLEHKNGGTKLTGMFLSWLEVNARDISFVFHLGARTDTAETNESLFNELNLNYSKEVWKICSTYQIPMVYASSAATYGDGSFGFEDNEAEMAHLKPLNPYGWSKQRFDEWVLLQEATPPVWAGLKFLTCMDLMNITKEGWLLSSFTVLIKSQQVVRCICLNHTKRGLRMDIKAGILFW